MRHKVLGLLSLLVLVATIGWADNWNKKTVLTIKEPLQVPGAVLQPGKYVLKLVETFAYRHVVRIMNEREDEVIATILAIPNYRLKPTDKSEFGFWETPAGNPPALRAWFYPGDNFGHEFAYPEGLSAKIAELNRVEVPSTPVAKEPELAQAPVVAIDKAGREKPLEAYLRPLTEPEATPQPTPEPAAAPAPVQADRPSMPATASPLPALALAGLFTLAAGFSLKLGTSRR